MDTTEQRAIAEWHRLDEIYHQAKRARLETVLLSVLASMNTIAHILGYEPASKLNTTRNQKRLSHSD